MGDVKRLRRINMLLVIALVVGCTSEDSTPAPSPRLAAARAAASVEGFDDIPYAQEYNILPPRRSSATRTAIGLVQLPIGWPRAGLVVPYSEDGFDREAWPESPTLDESAGEVVDMTADQTRMAIIQRERVLVMNSPSAIERWPLPEHSVPQRIVLTTAPSTVWLSTSTGVYARRIGDDAWHSIWSGSAVALAATPSGVCASVDEQLRCADATMRPTMSAAPPSEAEGPIVDIVANVSLPTALDLVVVHASSLSAWSGGTWRSQELFAAKRIPYRQMRRATRHPDGGIVIATAQGAMRLLQRDGITEWRVYNADRWLPSPDVKNIFTSDANVWFATSMGVSRAETKQQTLADKFAPFTERIVQRHDREGLVADSRLRSVGDLSTSVAWDSDNDAAWTSYWLRAECYRYLVTGDEQARAHVSKSLEALLRLRELTGMPHFIARSFIRIEGCKLDDCDNPDDGEWFKSPDQKYWVKGDTSNDEVAAHLGVMGTIYDLCSNDDEKARIRTHMSALFGGLIDHNWQLIDRDGLATRYGRWDPDYVLGLVGKLGDGGVRAAELLAGLTLTHYMTGDERFAAAKAKLINEYHYDVAAEHELEAAFRMQSEDNDEMDAWSWLVLNQYEPDDTLRAAWRRGWLALWNKKLKSQRATWWNLLNTMIGETDTEHRSSVRWLRSVPTDMIRWSVKNSDRYDLTPVGSEYFKRDRVVRSDGQPLPYDERSCDRWNVDQYKADDSFGGSIEMDGADALSSYWMARYYGVLRAAH